MTFYKILTISSMCLLLSACGGDGDGSTSLPSVEAPGDPPVNPEEPPVAPEEPPVAPEEPPVAPEEPLLPPVAFNFTSISALGSEKPEELSFIWDGDSTGLTYDICLFNSTKPNDCELIKTVRNVDQTSSFVPLTKYIDNDFFIIAKNEQGVTKSKSLTVGTDDINKVTQYIKAIRPKANEKFGTSASISADAKTMTIGTGNMEIGGVYIYYNDGEIWRYREKITTGIPGDAFGTAHSLSADGKTLAVGAKLSKKVYIYSLEQDTWMPKGFITGSEGNDDFGSSVDFSSTGDTLVVGANNFNNKLINTGAAYVFERKEGKFDEIKRLQGSHLQKEDEFGNSVSISGNGLEIAVGAFEDDLNYQGGVELKNSGAVYLFSKTSGLWKEDNFLKTETANENDVFGHSVSLNHDGNVLAVGSSHSGQVGNVFVFNKNNENIWEENPPVPAEGLQIGNYFGKIVELNSAGTVLAVSSYLDSSDGKGINPTTGISFTVNNSGSVHLFKLDSGQWKQTAYMKALNSEKMAFFGSAIAISDEGKLVIGANGEASNASGINGNMLDNSSPASGAAFVY